MVGLTSLPDESIPFPSSVLSLIMGLRELVEQLTDGVGSRMTGNIRQYRRCESNAYRRGGYDTRYSRS